MGGYRFGSKSEGELVGVHPILVDVVKDAIKVSTIDFAVHDGLRTLREQHEHVLKGSSTILNSLHLPQADGYGHAVDLVPYVNGKLRWEWGAIYHVALAMLTSARAKGVSLRWGGVWDRTFPTEFGTTAADMEAAVEAYVRRRVQAKKRAFIDGPHFELPL